MSKNIFLKYRVMILCHSQNQDVCINSVDFAAALHHVRPSVQRDSDMFLTNLPHITWNDIGGLGSVKEKLKQVLFLPNIKLLMFAFLLK